MTLYYIISQSKILNSFFEDDGLDISTLGNEKHIPKYIPDYDIFCESINDFDFLLSDQYDKIKCLPMVAYLLHKYDIDNLYNKLIGYIVDKILELDTEIIKESHEFRKEITDCILKYNADKEWAILCIIKNDLGSLKQTDYSLSMPLFMEFYKSPNFANFDIDNLEMAIKYDKGEIIDFVLSLKEFADNKYDIMQAIANSAAKQGNINFLKLALESNVSIMESINIAAYTGNIHIVIWAYANVNEQFDFHNIFNYAAQGGHIHILEWGLSIGKNPDSEICTNASINGKLNVVKWCVSKNVIPDNDTFIAAISNNNLEILCWLYDNGFRWEDTLYDMFEYANTKEMCEWLHSINCQWHPDTLENMVNRPHLLLWAYNKGCQLGNHDALLHEIVENGNIELLKWAKHVGCVFTNNIIIAAIYQGDYDIFLWLIQNGCPFNLEECMEIPTGSKKIQKYLSFIYNYNH